MSDVEKTPAGRDTVAPNGILFTHDDIAAVIDDFYTRIQFDPMLEVPFRSVHDWPEHIRRLTHFWWIRFGGKAYMFSHYNPVTKHFFAGFNDHLLARWLGLFHATLADHLAEDQVQFWKMLSERMGQSLSIRNEAFRREHEGL